MTDGAQNSLSIRSKERRSPTKEGFYRSKWEWISLDKIFKGFGSLKKVQPEERAP